MWGREREREREFQEGQRERETEKWARPKCSGARASPDVGLELMNLETMT